MPTEGRSPIARAAAWIIVILAAAITVAAIGLAGLAAAWWILTRAGA